MSDRTPMEVVELATNVDDASGEVLAAALQALLDAGALDVWTTAIGMKKCRPGVMVSVLARQEDQERLTALLLRTTGSFGVRHRSWQRTVLDRRFEQVATRYGEVTVKIGVLGDEVLTVRPEFESVRTRANEAGTSEREVMAAAEAAAQQWLELHQRIAAEQRAAAGDAQQDA